MKTKITLLLCMSVMLLACKKENVIVNFPDVEAEPVGYLNQWTGEYEGISDHWRSSPAYIDTVWFILNTHEDKAVSVTVHQSAMDSCLTLIVVYNQTDVVTNENIKISASGSHHSSWGGGSSYGSLSVNFNNDSLQYTYFQKCGIPCSSGINFKIRRN